MTQPDNAILLVGRRRAAVAAARSLGLIPDVVDPADNDAIRAAAAGDAPPVAVVACTEAAVVAASRLREGLSLPGLMVEAATRCTDKLTMKRTIEAAGLPCARFRPVCSGPLDAAGLADELGLPLVLKTRAGSGSRGTRVIRTVAGFPASVAGEHLAESFVEGVEMSVESFVVDGIPVFVNFTEYVEPGWANLLPASSATLPLEALLELNRRAIAALGVTRGMTHMEVFLTAAGPVFGELAARPPGGRIMPLLELAWGFDPWKTLLAIESGETVALPSEPVRAAGARFFHPGPGVVRATHGLETVCALPSAQTVVCKLAPGDVVDVREGTGQHRGYALFAGAEPQVRHDLEVTRRTLRVEMKKAGETA